MKRAARARAWIFLLYVIGQTPRSLAAIVNLKRLCAQHARGPYRIRIIDVGRRPELASADEIVAIPTTIRRSPAPELRMIGDLSDAAKAAEGLELGAWCR